ncbi:hypothetical protein EOD29_24110 [Mesorhizobium sp. M1A.T.Ca.IN.004.03.1.1]|nr:hypothetical protein EOD29_24110 [Mesorhizobium sp. M1A.T.Ca.IN.004.03.1.1]
MRSAPSPSCTAFSPRLPTSARPPDVSRTDSRRGGSRTFPDARQRADQSWARNKAPMAVYCKAVGVYAGHLHRVLRPTEPCWRRT